MVHTTFEAKHFGDNIEAVRIETIAVYELRDGDIALSGEGRQKIEPLKYEAYFVAAQLGSSGITHSGEIVAVNEDVALGSLSEATDEIQERRFSATRRTHNGNGLARQNGEIHTAKGGDFHLSGAIQFPHILRL
jgi:hypothetical protein